MFGIFKKEIKYKDIESAQALKSEVWNYFSGGTRDINKVAKYMQFLEEFSFLNFLSLDHQALKENWADAYHHNSSILFRTPFSFEYFKRLKQDDIKQFGYDLGERVYLNCVKGSANESAYGFCSLGYVAHYMFGYPHNIGGTSYIEQAFEKWVEHSQSPAIKRIFLEEVSNSWYECRHIDRSPSMSLRSQARNEIRRAILQFQDGVDKTLVDDALTLLDGGNFSISKLEKYALD